MWPRPEVPLLRGYGLGYRYPYPLPARPFSPTSKPDCYLPGTQKPMPYTLGQAAKATGKSKPTIQRAIKAGRLSAVRKDDGSYEIEPVELHRVYAVLPHDSNLSSSVKQSVPPSETGLLQAELAGVRGELEQVKSERDDLRRRLDAEAEERRRLTLLLTDQRPARRRRWLFWRGGEGG
jgi:hypothetical protein